MSEFPEPDFERLQRRARLDFNFHLLGDRQLKDSVNSLERAVCDFRAQLDILEERGGEPVTCHDLATTLGSFARMNALREQVQSQLGHSFLEESLGGLKKELAKLQIMAKLLNHQELLKSLQELDPNLEDFVNLYRERFFPDDDSDVHKNADSVE